MLYTKSILSPKSPEDGTRISIMAKHDWKNSPVNDSFFEEWNKTVAPPLKLLGDYYKRGLSWEDYEKRYNEHIKKPEVSTEINSLAKRAMSEDITLLCIEKTPEKCHRRLLAEECQKYQPNLKIIHK